MIRCLGYYLEAHGFERNQPKSLPRSTIFGHICPKRTPIVDSDSISVATSQI